ncbi:MAG: hypothetical protein LBR19_01170, partial [Bifidobacteriaceae bacterium]|nr:hypothetical protein [Bifidobacteriaceae bacterium]
SSDLGAVAGATAAGAGAGAGGAFSAAGQLAGGAAQAGGSIINTASAAAQATGGIINTAAQGAAQAGLQGAQAAGSLAAGTAQTAGSLAAGTAHAAGGVVSGSLSGASAAAKAGAGFFAAHKLAVIGVAVVAAAGVGVGGGVLAVNIAHKGSGQAASASASATASQDANQDQDQSTTQGNGLVVVNAPALGDSNQFGDGFYEAWRFDGVEGGAPTAQLVTQDVIVVSQDYLDLDPNPVFLGLDPATGEVLWQYGENYDGGRGCEPEAFAGLAVCWHQSDTGRWPFAIDLATGNEASLGLDTVYDETEDAAYWTFVSQGALYVMMGSPSLEGDVELSRWTAPGELDWTTAYARLPGTDFLYSFTGYTGQVDDLLVVDEYGYRTVYDVTDGTQLTGEDGCGAPAVFAGNQIACAVGDGGGTPSQVTLANGATATLTPVSGTPLVFLGPQRPETILVVESPDQALHAIDPDTGAVIWTADTTVDPWSVAAYDGSGLVALVSEQGDIGVIDLAARGALKWRVTSDQGIATEDHWAQPVVGFLDQTAIWAEHYSASDSGQFDGTAMPADDGASAWQADLSLASAEGTLLLTGQGFAIGTYNPSTGGGAADLAAAYVARLDPGTGPGDSIPAVAAATLPEGFPACPDGMAPLIWSQYPDGYVLVCGGDQAGFQAFARRAGQDLTVTKLTFIGQGCELEFESGEPLVIALGGGLVSDGAAGLVAAQEGWSWRVGPVVFSEGPAANPALTCPEGSWPIAWSAYQGAAVLVCGQGQVATRLAYVDPDMGQGTSDAVEASDGSYCADVGGNRVCVYDAPAVVVFGLADGNEVQRTVVNNFFPGVGQGGAGQGEGAYNVTAPQANAADQVRYLVDILNKSAEARGGLQAAVDAVGLCQDVSGQVTVLEGIAQNRRDLLAALESTPVDLIDQGAELVANLRTALQNSLGADEGYVEWAQAQLDTGCQAGAGQDARDRAIAFNEPATDAKKAFLEIWNGVIVPQYGVQTFEDFQI